MCALHNSLLSCNSCPLVRNIKKVTKKRQMVFILIYCCVPNVNKIIKDSNVSEIIIKVFPICEYVLSWIFLFNSYYFFLLKFECIWRFHSFLLLFSSSADLAATYIYAIFLPWPLSLLFFFFSRRGNKETRMPIYDLGFCFCVTLDFFFFFSDRTVSSPLQGCLFKNATLVKILSS